ncbi:MAG: Gfo/Idh/MocA family protein [Planctomycetota bacterium]|jgi:predicted dehydrogenase
MATQREERRGFLKAASLGATPLALPSYCRADAEVRKGRIIKGRKINVAAIGCGSKGAGDIAACGDENVVALCDVDFKYVARCTDWGPSPLHRFPKAKRYNDYRRMLREMDDRIDAVTISAPDHMHFPSAMMAIEMGKHVFVQKPLTHTIEEARLLAAAARKHEVVTVMGNQGHCGEGIRRARESIQQGFLGDVREVHIWSGCPEWPQGYQKMPEPQQASGNVDVQVHPIDALQFQRDVFVDDFRHRLW